MNQYHRHGGQQSVGRSADMRPFFPLPGRPGGSNVLAYGIYRRLNGHRSMLLRLLPFMALGVALLVCAYLWWAKIEGHIEDSADDFMVNQFDVPRAARRVRWQGAAFFAVVGVGTLIWVVCSL
ncbi:hypothetical protein [Actinomadura parmotrematis]|uniref:CD225/dispanin family protein n=1 Tax=Actinomadura parmotrematis TaxID=2864039 RepID=A0ABS7FNR1_9ACTN|nr:hypothetical protein [Actinomadura parmotrematis]MBW8481419.1 hypothetical protein [Actinomadura parmotrematis]